MQRRLIVNADDFGHSSGINRGILQAHDQGIVTSTSLMVRYSAAAEASAAAQSRPRLSVGLHVDLGEWKLEGPEWVPVYDVTAIHDASAVQGEIQHQLDAFRRLMGRDPTHLDSHQHVHRKEPATSILIELASQLDIPLRHFCPQVNYCGAFYGQDENGHSVSEVLTVPHLIGILASLGPGVTELACHPGFLDDLNSMYCNERLLELSILCDQRVKETIDSLGIELCSFCNALGSSA